jgi:2-dehydropantoate 2-reductase
VAVAGLASGYDQPAERIELVRIAVFGAGGIGGYFGGRLASAGADVHLIARGPHLRALRADGLRVRSVRGDSATVVHATDDPADVGACDCVLFCVKAYDTQEAAEQLAPLLHEETAVVSLQNGVDNEEKIAAAIGANHVLGGVAYVFASVVEPGVIRHTGGAGGFTFGELDGSQSERGARLCDLCGEAGIPAELVADIRARLWQKFAFICAQGGVTASARVALGQIRETPETWHLFVRIVDEVVALAAAEGVSLAPEVAAAPLAWARSLEPTVLSSLHDDLVHGRRMELEALHGFVVRRSGEHGLQAPISEMIYALLKPHALHNDAAQPEATAPGVIQR